MLDKKLISIMACPICKGELYYDRDAAELLCYADGLAFPIKDDIPVMLEDEARELSVTEREQRKDKKN